MGGGKRTAVEEGEAAVEAAGDAVADGEGVASEGGGDDGKGGNLHFGGFSLREERSRFWGCVLSAEGWMLKLLVMIRRETC